MRASDFSRGYKGLRIILTTLAVTPMAAEAVTTWPR